MGSPSEGISSLTKVEAIFSNPALYELAERVPDADRSRGGRPRTYPAFMWLAFEALISVFESARQAEAELAHPVVWNLVRSIVAGRFPDDPAMQIPKEPMRRYHHAYGRDRYLCDPTVLGGLGELHRELAVRQARGMDLLDPDGPGSWARPDLTRVLYADGKVMTPLYRARPGETRVDTETGEIREVRAEEDAGLHFEGDGETAWGIKFVLVAARAATERGRVILDLEWVPKPGGEAAVAMACFRRLAPLVPGAQAVVYDTALRGVHHQMLLRELGLVPINRVTAAEKGASAPRRGKGRRVEKTVHVEDKDLTLPDGSTTTLRLFARAGAIGVVELTDHGEPYFVELTRIRTHRIADKSGRYRWYNGYALPERYGGGSVSVRLHGTEEDAARRFNRTENVRVIPPSDPSFRRLYARRNDAESINRGVVDSMYLGRAHSVGHLRQKVNLLGYALMVNSLSLLLASSNASPPLPQAA
jgi:hypothetical protein